MNGSRIYIYGSLWWAVRRLRYQWLQSFFIVLGLGLGVAVLTTVATQLVQGLREFNRIVEREPFFKQVMVTPKQRAAEVMGPEAPVAWPVTDLDVAQRPEPLTLADLLDVRKNVPGVRYALLNEGSTGITGVARDGEPVQDTHVVLQPVTPDQFQADQRQLLAGAFFTWDDLVAARPLLVVDESWVKGFFPELSSPSQAIGHTVVTAPLGGPGAGGRTWTIVGVVADPEEEPASAASLDMRGWGRGGRFRGQPVNGDAYVPATAVSTAYLAVPLSGSSSSSSSGPTSDSSPASISASSPASSPASLSGSPPGSSSSSDSTAVAPGNRESSNPTQTSNPDEPAAIDPRQVTYYTLVFQPEPGISPAALARRIQAYLDTRLGRDRVQAFAPVEQVAEARREQWRSYAALAGLASLALFIGAINVLNLNLAHVLQRQRYIGLAAALGASRRRLVGQSLVEALSLGLGGGLLGAILTYPGLRLLFLLQTRNVPEASRAQLALSYQLDPWVLLAGVALGGLLSLLFGLVPSWQVSRISPAEVLRE